MPEASAETGLGQTENPSASLGLASPSGYCELLTA